MQTIRDLIAAMRDLAAAIRELAAAVRRGPSTQGGGGPGEED